MRSLTSEDLHKTLLDIAKEFDGICRKHNIPYYMLGGTMLGAVRHKGFIPWDDDMDFGVPREHFAKLIVALERELPDCYELVTMDNSDAVFYDLVKLADKRTLIKELFKGKCKKEWGVNVDIFVLDNTDSDKSLLSKNWQITTLKKVLDYKYSTLGNRPLHKDLLAVVVKVLTCPFGRYSIRKYINKLIRKGGGNYIANFYGAWALGEIVPQDWMGEPQPYKFEDTELMGVEDAHSYLTSLYGNYMELPPENKRHLHIENMWFR